MSLYWSALLFAVCANICTNVSFKLAVQQLSGPFDIRALVVSPWAWAGLISGLLLLSSFIVAIRGLELSIAYPAVTGLAMVGILVVGYFLFSETLNLQKIVGIGLVIAGVFVLSQVKQA
ncbi:MULTISPECIES: DMT family transporter [Ruegeria]|uniref:DMT family transporter n=1 Tax=Ruegeria TaxID=97050 RepID=UPI00147BDD81|nr:MULTISPECIES: SMR family transporter [Ruegeria]